MTNGTLLVAHMRDWDIIVDPRAEPAECYAAEELRHWFGLATGRDLPIRPDAQGARWHVYVGPDVWPAAGGPAVNTMNWGTEGFSIVVAEDRIAIAGDRPRGTLYGVYQFLEDAIEVRFLTYDHTHVPDMRNAEIGCGRRDYAPPFARLRWSAYLENREHHEFAARLRVNTVIEDERLGGKTGLDEINHTTQCMVPFGRYGVDYPEYYAQVVDPQNCGWVRDRNTSGGGPQLCVTNCEVIKIAAQWAIDKLAKLHTSGFLRTHPDAERVSVSQADTDRYCRCAACEAINVKEGSPMGAQLAFVNAVAKLVAVEYPRAKVGTLAYNYTRKPPANIKPEPNVQIQLCSIECCTLHAIDDRTCVLNFAFRQDLTDWEKICNSIWIWHYNTNFSYYDLPFPNLRSIGPNVRFYWKNNAQGMFMQGNLRALTGELSDLRNYLTARLLWNPEQDDKALLNEFLRLHYRSASEPIRKGIELLHDNAERAGVHPGCFAKPACVGLTPDVARQLLACYDEALRLAEDEEDATVRATVRARVEKASIPAYRAMLEVGQLDAAECAPLVRRYVLLCQRYHMEWISELEPFDARQVKCK